MTIPSLLAQLEATTQDLDLELRTVHPTMKRPEVNIILQAVRQLRDRLDREGRSGPQTTLEPAGVNYHPGLCARRRGYRTPGAAGQAALKFHDRGARVISCVACGLFHVESEASGSAKGAAWG